MHKVREKTRHASLLLSGLFWIFDVVTQELVRDITRSLLVLPASIDISGGAQSIRDLKGQMNQKVEIFSFVALPSPNAKKNYPK